MTEAGPCGTTTTRSSTPTAAAVPRPATAADTAPLLQLQRDAGNAAVAGVLGTVGSGGGAALDRDTRSFMEQSIGHDFSDGAGPHRRGR